MDEATTVEAIMNHEVYTVRTTELVGEVLGMILSLGITAAPVVDEAGVPLGLVSLRNLARAGRGEAVGHHMTTPAATISPAAGIDEAGRQMGQLGYHHLVVVDEHERVVGFVSSLDVIRGFVELPAEHPRAFPHQDPDSGLRWSPTLPLNEDNIEQIAGTGAGMLVLTAADDPEQVLWAEASNHVQARLIAFARGDHGLPEPVAARLAEGAVGFRCAAFAREATSGEADDSVIEALLHP